MNYDFEEKILGTLFTIGALLLIAVIVLQIAKTGMGFVTP